MLCWHGIIAAPSMKESALPKSQKALQANLALQTSLQLNSCTILLASSTGKTGTSARVLTGMVELVKLQGVWLFMVN